MWAWVALAARAQDTTSGSDLLDLSRRAAVVDQVLADHLALMREARVFGTDQRVRFATNTSFYLVSDLRLTTPEEGTYEVELSRAYTGFLVDVLGKPRADGSPGEQVFYLTGGGLAYGLSRPFELPMGPVDGEPALPSANDDLTGAQYSDEQYTAGARWRGFSAEGSWARGQLLQATDDGRADVSTLEQRLNRAQVVVDTPLGVRLSTRWALGGPLENLAVDLRVNDALAAVDPPEAPITKVPELTLGFRKSDYDGADARSHPRILGAGVSEDLRWLFGEPRPEKGAWTANARAQADLDLAAPNLQLALSEAELGWFGRGEVAAHLGGSWFSDPGLAAIVGRTGIAGVQGGGHLGASLKVPECGRGGVDEDGVVCAPNLGLRAVLTFTYRESWAEELRYVAEYAGKPQTYVYVELLGGV